MTLVKTSTYLIKPFLPIHISYLHNSTLIVDSSWDDFKSSLDLPDDDSVPSISLVPITIHVSYSNAFSSSLNDDSLYSYLLLQSYLNELALILSRLNKDSSFILKINIITNMGPSVKSTSSSKDLLDDIVSKSTDLHKVLQGSRILSSSALKKYDNFFDHLISHISKLTIVDPNNPLVSSSNVIGYTHKCMKYLLKVHKYNISYKINTTTLYNSLESKNKYSPNDFYINCDLASISKAIDNSKIKKKREIPNTSNNDV